MSWVVILGGSSGPPVCKIGLDVMADLFSVCGDRMGCLIVRESLIGSPTGFHQANTEEFRNIIHRMNLRQLLLGESSFRSGTLCL